MSLSHWRCSGTGPAPRSAMTAAGPFLVEMRILPSRRAFCLREQRLELHSRVRSARLGAGGSRRGRRPTRGAPPGDPRRHRLSESVAKARIEPRRAKGIVGIPRFFSRSIPARGAFATDSDTPPPRTAAGAPPAPPCARPRHHDDPGRSGELSGEKSPLRRLGTGGVRDEGRKARAGRLFEPPDCSPAGSPAPTAPFSLRYAFSPSTAREKEAQRRVKGRSRREEA